VEASFTPECDETSRRIHQSIAHNPQAHTDSAQENNQGQNLLSEGQLRASDQACPAATEGVATSDGCETSSRPIHHRAKSDPPPAFSLEPTSPESTAPEDQIPYIRCLSERRGLRRRTPTVSEKRVLVCFIHLMCSNGRPCGIPQLLSPETKSSSLCILTGILNRGSPLFIPLQCRSSQVSLLSNAPAFYPPPSFQVSLVVNIM
jgi:hypothetical protein